MKNIKIRAKNTKHSLEVQGLLLAINYEWDCEPYTIKHLDKPFLFATIENFGGSNYARITYTDDREFFDTHPNEEVTLEDLKRILKEKTMEQDKRPVQITKEQAKEMLENGCEISKRIALDTYPELEVKKLPKQWKDVRLEECYYITANNIIRTLSEPAPAEQNKNMLPNEALAEVQQIQPELLTMRNIYRDGWEPCDRYNWSVVFNATLQKWDVIESRREIFTFPSKEVAEEFLENFEEQLNVWAKVYA